MTIEQLKYKIALEIDADAFAPLTSTFEFCTAFQQQQRRQDAALAEASARVSAMVQSLVSQNSDQQRQ